MMTKLGLSMKDTYKTIRENLEYKHLEQLFKIKYAIIGYWGSDDPILNLINIDLKRICGSNNKNFSTEMYIAKRNGEIIEMPIGFDITTFLVNLLNYYNY